MRANNIFQIAAVKEMMFEEFLNQTGKERKTSFMSDFTIADHCGGKEAVEDTYNRSFDAYKNNVEYMSELYIVLNHKIWEHYEDNEPLARLYNDLWDKCGEYCTTHFTGNDLSYFYEVTD